MVKSSSKGKHIGKKRKSFSTGPRVDTAVPEVETSSPTSERDSVNELRDGETFAATSAPWVGAEKAWRQGIVPPPHEDWIHYKTKLDPNDLPKSAGEDLELTDLDVATVLSSLPPPPAKADAEAKTDETVQFLKYAAVAVFTGAAMWAVFSVVHQEDSRSVNASPNATAQAPAVIPATQSLPVSESSIATPDKLPLPTPTPPALVPEQSSQLPAFEKRRSSHSAASVSVKISVSAPEAAANPPTPLSPDEAAMEESAQDSQVAFGLSNPYAAPEPLRPTIKKAIDSEGLPVTLSRQSVQTVMKSIQTEVLKCKGTRSGRMVMDLRVAGTTGRVIEAEAISAEFRDSPEGHCAARAVQLAKFPKFQDDSLSIKYPFDL
jgi:hypothetical protein